MRCCKLSSVVVEVFWVEEFYMEYYMYWCLVLVVYWVCIIKIEIKFILVINNWKIIENWFKIWLVLL